MEDWERVTREILLDANKVRVRKGKTPRTEEEIEKIIEEVREERKEPDYFKRREISEEELKRRFGRTLTSSTTTE